MLLLGKWCSSNIKMVIIPSFLTHQQKERERENLFISFASLNNASFLRHTPSVSRWLQFDIYFGRLDFGASKVQEAWSPKRSCRFNRIKGIFEGLLSLRFSDVETTEYSWESKSGLSFHWKESSGLPGVLWLCDGTCGHSVLAFGWTQGNGRAQDTGSQARQGRSGPQTPGILSSPRSFPTGLLTHSAVFTDGVTYKACMG